MPDNTKPPRTHRREPDDGPPVGAHLFMQEVRELAAKKTFERFEVRYKRNAKGENVVAVIWPGWRKD